MIVRTGALPDVASVLVVCAHPDDESFGLGAVVRELTARGTKVSVLCFTHGEASTLHGARVPDDLGAVRARELSAAGTCLGVDGVELLDYPDGALSTVDGRELTEHVIRVAGAVGAAGLLVFDDGGITGHPDHQAATDAARSAGDVLDVIVLAWAVPASVAASLNSEFGTTFTGREAGDCEIVLEVDRAAQLAAIACHVSQSTDNPVLRRRLELQGGLEVLRRLR